MVKFDADQSGLIQHPSEGPQDWQVVTLGVDTHKVEDLSSQIRWANGVDLVLGNVVCGWK